MARERMKSRKRNSKRGYSRKTIKKSRRSKIIKRSKRSKRQNTRKLNRHRKLRGGADSHEVGPRTDAEIMEEGKRVAALAQKQAEKKPETTSVVQPEDQILAPFLEEAEENINSLNNILNEIDDDAMEMEKNPKHMYPHRVHEVRPFEENIERIIERARTALDKGNDDGKLDKSAWWSGESKLRNVEGRVRKIVRTLEGYAHP